MNWVLVGSLLAVSLSGCSVTFNSEASICNQDQRTELLNVQLQDDVDTFTPSPPFTLTDGFTGWIQVTRDPESAEHLFGTIAGIAEVYAIHNGATPMSPPSRMGTTSSTISPSPSISRSPGRGLPLKSGSWQLYSFSNPGIEVVGCPTG